MKAFAVVGLVVLAVLVVVGLAILFAYPTMWVVNYLFSAAFLTFVFGSAKLSLTQALVLNIASGLLFKGSSYSPKSEK